MRPADDIHKAIKKLKFKASAELDRKVHDDISAALAQSGTTKSAAVQPNILRIIMKSPVTKIPMTAVIIAAVLIGIYLLRGGIDVTSVAWADVAKRFRSVPFFSASIYMKEDALARPEQFELWMGRAGQVRMRVGTQVIFSQRGQMPRAFDLKKRQEVEPDPRAAEIIEMLEILEPEGSFSIETVIRIISGDELIDVTPLMNDAVLREDLVVFDVKSETEPEWLRIYALRKTKLPVGIRIWNPCNGKCEDVFITYSKDQPDIFFDVKAFSTKLKQRHINEADLAYMFLKDPGGQRIITPKGSSIEDER